MIPPKFIDIFLLIICYAKARKEFLVRKWLEGNEKIIKNKFCLNFTDEELS